MIVIGGEDGHDYYLSDVHILDAGSVIFLDSLTITKCITQQSFISLYCLSSFGMLFRYVLLIIMASLNCIRYASVEGAEHFRPIITTPRWSFYGCFWEELICFWGIHRCTKSIQ